jgi:hypothetical protein
VQRTKPESAPLAVPARSTPPDYHLIQPGELTFFEFQRNRHAHLRSSALQFMTAGCVRFDIVASPANCHANSSRFQFCAFRGEAGSLVARSSVRNNEQNPFPYLPQPKFAIYAVGA